MKKPEIPDHHSVYSFPMDKSYCESHSKELEPILQQLNTLFAAVGTGITISDFVLNIDVNEEKFSSVTTRKAGRKAKGVNKLYEEVQEYRKTHTAMETAEWLGLTKQTYYRRMKEWREESQN